MNKRPPGPTERRRRLLAGHALAVLLVGITLAIRLLLADAAGGNAVAIIFIPAILVSAYVGGLGPGLSATVLSAATSDYLLLPPIGSFAIQLPVHRVQWSLLWLVGIAIGVLFEALHRTRRRLEERTAMALESEERFRIMADGSPIILWVTDAHGGNQFVNRTYREYFGVTLEEVAGSKWQAFYHPEDVQKYVDAFRAAVEERRSYAEEARVRRQDGEWRWVASRGDPRYSATGEYLGHVGLSLDITDRRRLEEQVRLSQRLESVGRLAGGVAHDFNNLLTVILGCAETLKEDASAGAPTQPEVIEEIQAAGQRAAELTGQLLTFARKQVIAPVPLDLNATLRGSEKLLRRVLGEDVELVVSCQPALWTVRCDPGQIEQVILNLAINARDAMPGGGRLTVETSNTQIDDRLVALHPYMRGGPHVRLTVSDTGVGMGPEVKPHVFEPFFTTKPPGKGTGLGLATVYGIVKQSAGYILLESEAGQGTTFSIYFPRTLDATVTPPAAVTSASRGTETVLLVEDDPLVRDVTLRSLQAGGYRVVVAGNGREALEAAERVAGPLHLLVADVVMPGLGGREVAERLRHGRPGLRVLYVSGYTDNAISRAGVVEPGVELLPKPFTPATLLARVRAVLDAR